MKKKSIVLRAENEYMQKKGYLSFLNLDKDGHLDYKITESPRNAMSYKTADMKNEHSHLNKQLAIIREHFPELIITVEVLILETMPYDIFQKYKSQDF